MKTINLTRGQVALVDDEDYEWLNQWKWNAHWCEGTQTFYAVRHSETVNGKRHSIWMHRLILGLEFGNPLQGDHKEPSATLDNRRDNLRVATRAQNMANRRPNRRGRSRYKGVCWHKARARWCAQIAIEGIPKTLGCFSTEEDAYAAYCQAAKLLRGEFARTA
jgi:hypothetical protein